MQTQQLPLNYPARVKPFEHLPHKQWWLKLLEGVTQTHIQPQAEDYQNMMQALWQGDALMDEVVQWILQDNVAARRKLFMQALEQGTATIENCPAVLEQFFQQVEAVPHWVDETLLEEAVRFIQATGENAQIVLRDAALMGGYLLAAFNQVLIKTGALNKGAAQRLAETTRWWMDCTAQQGWKRQAAGWKSTLHVRFIHAMVRHYLSKREDWNNDDLGLPICQLDMAATNLAFSALFLTGLRSLGIFATAQEAKAVMHLWKYMGWLMGIDEAWLYDTEKQGLIALYQMQFMHPEPDWTCQELGKALSLEPLERQYRYFGEWQQKMDYFKHLSYSRYFLLASGKKSMRQLGLPDNIPALYPLLSLPYNLIYFNTRWLTNKKLSPQQIVRGRRAQHNALARYGEHGKTLLKATSAHPANRMA